VGRPERELSSTTHERGRRLSRRWELAILAFCVGLFLVVNGPIWRHPFAPDISILASYVPIPLLVAAALLYESELTVGSFLVETLLIAILKFGVTATILISIFMLQPTPDVLPPRRIAAPARRAPHSPAAPEAPSVIADARRGELAGLVLDRVGKPVPGALVWVSSGLEAWRFPPPRETVVLKIGGGFVPTLLAVAVRQPLLVSSSDGRLHTLDIRSGGRTVMNAPVLDAAPRAVTIEDAAGLCEVRCDIHPGERGALLVLAHPFATRAGADGRFALAGVPAGEVTLAALVTGTGKPAAVRVRVPARARAEVTLRVE